MNPSPDISFEQLLRSNGLAWMIDAFPGAKMLDALLLLLGRTGDEFHRRFDQPAPFAPDRLAAEAKRNPHKVKAFLQALGVSNSPEMLVMVWRILQGLTIRQVSMEYREQEQFALDAWLAPPGPSDNAIEHYRSTDINDATLVRHFGVASINGKPLFEGFYPLRVRDDISTLPEHVET